MINALFFVYFGISVPIPSPPGGVVADSTGHDSVHVCWDAPTLRGDSVTHYTLQYKEVPRLPFLGITGYD